MNASRGSAIFQGIKDSLPLIVAAIPFGIVYGALAQTQGLADWITVAISILVFAGASQFIAVTMLAAGAALPIIVLTVFIVNLRHSLYSIALVPFIQRYSNKIRMFMGFALTDETFAVTYNRATSPRGLQDLKYYYLGSAGAMYLNWQICTWVGIVAGNHFPSLTSFGLDIAMVVAFIGIVVPHLKLTSHWLCAIVALTGGLLTYHWPHQSGLLFSSLLAIMVGVWSENTLTNTTQEEESNHD